ncbi:MAG: hypothetical protein ACOYS2_02405 [Patescibacteria group bacterium]
MSEKIDKIQKIIEESGNSFHYEVIKYFENKEWRVLVSPYYNDYSSDKAKEVDIIVQKDFPVKDHWGKVLGFTRLNLFIECKYINHSVVFWFHKKDNLKAEEKIVSETSLKRFINNSSISKHHHYYVEEVAKLFSSNSNREDVIFKAISQCLNSMVYFRRNTRDLFPDTNSRASFKKILKTINYPLIIHKNPNNLYRIFNSGYQEIDENFLLEINYSYIDNEKRSQSEYFLIDVVNFEKMDSFIEKILEKDMEVICNNLSYAS